MKIFQEKKYKKDKQMEKAMNTEKEKEKKAGMIQTQKIRNRIIYLCHMHYFELFIENQ